MIITIPWLKEHLKTTAKESEIINQLTNIGLEVEEVKENLEKGCKTGASNKLRTMFKDTNYDNPQFIMVGINIVLKTRFPIF